jgi:LmeA-like phospholipid-binding
MELISIILSSLFSVFSTSGLFVDRAIAKSFRSQFTEVKNLNVRVDNAPSYQILEGKIDKVRLASRGLKYKDEIGIDTFELETDAIDVNRKELKKINLKNLRKSLRVPLNAGFHIIVTETELNQALQSEKIKTRIQKLLNRAIPGNEESSLPSYQILSLNFDLLDNNRISTQVQLNRPNPDPLADEELQEQFDQPLNVRLEFGLNLARGTSIQIVEPTGTVNGKAISTKLLNGFARGFSSRINLRKLEEDGLLVRLLQLNIDDRAIDLAAVTSLAPFTSASSLSQK